MKRLIIAIALILGLTLPAFAGNMKEAKDRMTAGMYEAACTTLEAEINGSGKIKGNPLNAEAHLLLGESYLYLNPPKMVTAKERFKSAVRLNAKLAKQVAPAYKKAGEQRLNDGESEYARLMFNEAVLYQPSITDEIAKVVLAYGKEHVEDLYLSLAVQYSQGGLAKEVAEFYYDLSKKTDGEPGLVFIKKADEYSGGAYKAEIGGRAIQVCDSKSRPEDRKTCIDRNSDYLDSDQIFESSVRFYTKLFGSPVKVMKLEEGWIEAVVMRPGERIHYLSLNSFWLKDVGGSEIYRAEISKPYSIRFEYGDMKGNDSTPVWLKKNNADTMVYVWVEKK